MKKRKIEMTDEVLHMIQQVDLEMLIEVDRVCRRNGIRYSLDGGTLLGAVRHRGFIPWDNDVDVIMRREEYEKFAEVCKRELDTSRFFLQDYRTDSNYYFGYAKLRRKNSRFTRIGQEHMKQHNGIFIDIFVVDNVPDAPVIRDMHHFAAFLIRKGMYSQIGRKNADGAGMRTLYEFISFIPRDIWFSARNMLAASTAGKKTGLVSHLTYQYPPRCRYGLPSVCFDDYTELEFEGRKFMAFKEYDLYLSSLYGDYMTLPPVEDRKSDTEICELEFPPEFCR